MQEAIQPVISVIVCTYNQEDTIGRTLDSILRQRCCVPFEIIIGEDASTDRTCAVCQQYAEQYPGIIRLYANEHNKGVVDNYFDCILNAKGKYIADLAGDDEWCDDEKLEKEWACLEHNEDVTIVHSAYKCRDEITGAITSSPHKEEGVVDGRKLLVQILTQTRHPVIHLCTALYRRDVFLKVYHEHTEFFRDNDYPCEDLQLCFLFAMNGKVAYLDHHTLLYGIGGRSITNPQAEEKLFRFVKRATQLSYDLARCFSVEDRKLEEYFSYRIYALLMHAFRSHSATLRAEALECQQTWGVKLSLKAKCVKFVTSSSILWKMGLKLRGLIIHNS